MIALWIPIMTAAARIGAQRLAPNLASQASRLALTSAQGSPVSGVVTTLTRSSSLTAIQFMKSKAVSLLPAGLLVGIPVLGDILLDSYVTVEHDEAEANPESPDVIERNRTKQTALTGATFVAASALAGTSIGSIASEQFRLNQLEAGATSALFWAYTCLKTLTTDSYDDSSNNHADVILRRSIRVVASENGTGYPGAILSDLNRASTGLQLYNLLTIDDRIDMQMFEQILVEVVSVLVMDTIPTHVVRWAFTGKAKWKPGSTDLIRCKTNFGVKDRALAIFLRSIYRKLIIPYVIVGKQPFVRQWASDLDIRSTHFLRT